MPTELFDLGPQPKPSARRRKKAAPSAATEMVNHPNHYGGNTTYECIKVLDAWGVGFAVGSAIKYLCRAGKKPGADTLEDLRKAAWYIAHEIERVEASLNKPKVAKS